MRLMSRCSSFELRLLVAAFSVAAASSSTLSAAAEPAPAAPVTGNKQAAPAPAAAVAPAAPTAQVAPTATKPAELPPPAPPAWTAPPAPPASEPAGEMHAHHEHGHEHAAVEKRIEELEAKLAAMQAAEAKSEAKHSWLDGLKMSGYLQPQMIDNWYNAASSPNSAAALKAGVGSNDVSPKTPSSILGADSGYGLNLINTSNTDYFKIRRGRLKTEFMPNEYSRFVMEIDPFNAGGPFNGTGTVARNVEADGIIHWSDDVVTDFGVGMFKIPYGFEVLQSDADRPFIERSWWEQNVTPAEFGIGAKAYTRALDGKLVGQVAVVNGTLLGESTFVLIPDLHSGKDLVGRLAYNFGMFDLGVSGYYGSGEAVNMVATTALPVAAKNYARMSGNIEAAFHHSFSPDLGMTKLFGELNFGQNMDRGVKYSSSFAVPSIPLPVTNSVTNVNEMGAFIRLEQDITKWETLGFRYDYYTTDTSFGNNGRNSYAAVSSLHFTKNLQWMCEFNYSIDNIHALTGTAPSKQYYVLSNVLQVRF